MWRSKTVQPMSHLTSLKHRQMAKTNMSAMNSALPGDMGLQTNLTPTLFTIWLDHLRPLAHCWTMSLLAPVWLAHTLDLTTTLHVLAAAIVILWLLKGSKGQ